MKKNIIINIILYVLMQLILLFGIYFGYTNDNYLMLFYMIIWLTLGNFLLYKINFFKIKRAWNS